MHNRLDIGFISSGYRVIEDGKAYDRYFSSPDHRDRFIRDGDVYTTVDLMKKVVWKYIRDTKPIAAFLKRTTLKQTCERIWNFLYHHIQYKLDEKGLEQLRRPNRSWAERRTGIDCDCFSIFVSSILTNLQIAHAFRITKYDKNTFQHVYVSVPIPGSTNEYIIDCVLGRFNYEKPFTDKIDFPMSLEKIDIAVLSGTDTDVLDVISGLDGLDDPDTMELLGGDSDTIRSKAIYEHLVKTRNLIAQKPFLIAQVDYPPAFIQMLDYAIANWHTPNRTAALENLSRNEEVLNRMSGMDGMPDDTELDGTDDLWSHIDGLSLGEIVEELNGKKRKAKKKGKKGFFRKIGQAVKKGVQKGVKALVRFNPLSIAARNGFLLAMKLNLKKMASKLKWGYASKEQAAAKGVSTMQWEKSKKALSKIEKLFADKLQGKKSALRNAILKGKAGGINGLSGPEEEIDLRGLGLAPAAALAAAIPVITAALKIMTDTGIMKKGEAQNVESDVNAKASEAETTNTDAAIPAESAESAIAPADASQDSSPASAPSAPAPSEMVIPTPEPAPPAETTMPAIPENTSSSEPAESAPAIPDASTDSGSSIVPAEPEQAEILPPEAEASEATPANSNVDTIDGIFDLVQSKPILIAGGIGLGLWGLSWLLTRDKKKTAERGLSGPPAYRKKKRNKGPARRSHSKSSKRKTVKAITLQ